MMFKRLHAGIASAPGDRQPGTANKPVGKNRTPGPSYSDDHRAKARMALARLRRRGKGRRLPEARPLHLATLDAIDTAVGGLTGDAYLDGPTLMGIELYLINHHRRKEYRIKAMEALDRALGLNPDKQGTYTDRDLQEYIAAHGPTIRAYPPTNQPP